MKIQKIHVVHFSNHFYAISLISLLLLELVAAPMAIFNSNARASGSDTFSLSPSSVQIPSGQTFNITLNETSNDAINAVQANISYNTAIFQYNSVVTGSAAGSPFTICGQASGGGGLVNIGCAIPNTTATGTKPVAIISFTLLANRGSGTISISSGSGSVIVLASNQSDVWNGASATTTISVTPATTSLSNGGGSSSGGGSPSSGSSGTKNTAPKTTPASPSPSTTTSTTTQPSFSTSKTNVAIVEAAPIQTITIKVLDSKTKPLRNALVSFDSQTHGVTDKNGEVTFKTGKLGVISVLVTPNNATKAIVRTIYINAHQPGQIISVKIPAQKFFITKIEIAALVFTLLVIFSVLIVYVKHTKDKANAIKLVSEESKVHINTSQIAQQSLINSTQTEVSSHDVNRPVEYASPRPVINKPKLHFLAPKPVGQQQTYRSNLQNSLEPNKKLNIPIDVMHKE